MSARLLGFMDLRRRVVVLLPCLLGLACTDPIQLEDESGDSQVDSTDGAPMTTTVTTGMTTAPTTVGTTTATTGMTTVPGTTAVPTATVTTAPDGTDTDAPIPDCPGVGLGSAAIGEGCSASAECLSGLCTIYTDAPLNPDASCDVPPFDCSMRITGTTLDIVTGQAVPGVDVVIASALQAATNPAGAMPLAAGPSAPDGRLDVVSDAPIVEPIGIVALLQAPGFVLTATAVAEPIDGVSELGVANDVHDLWLVSNDAVAAWSAMLATDPTIPPELLPLGDAGGVVGLVRDASGVPLAGATVSSTQLDSNAIIRYLANDGTFNSVATGDLGLFVVLDPLLGDELQAELDGLPLDSGPAFSVEGAVFTLALTAP